MTAFRPMRTLALFLCLIPLTALAQSRADSARHQALPHNQQQSSQPGLQHWPQDMERTQIFCDQYARAAGGTNGRNTGSQTGNTFGRATGYAVTRDEKQAEGLGIIGGAVGSAQGAKTDKQFQSFHFNECMAGKRLIATPK
ncbi:hypothetical protein [Shimia sp.]|uniref:hypothetical protein n=1 Tax=Shimia sp. TaxID=1954381 RepID=UPI003296889B